MLSNLSIVMPTFNNQHMLKEIIAYHAGTNAQFFIIDASEKAYTIPSEYTQFNNIHYYHMPNSSFYDRIQFTLPKIKTEYATMRSDRRHLANHYLKTSIDFLNTNNDYAVVNGIWLCQESLKPVYLINMLSCAGDLGDPFDRVRALTLSYQPTFYSLTSSIYLRFTFDVVCAASQKNGNVYFLECIQSFLYSFLGKHKQTTHIQALAQKKEKASIYQHEGYEVVKILEDPDILEYVYSSINEHALKYNICFDAELLRKTLKDFFECFIKSYNLHNAVSTSNEHGIKKQEYLTKIYEMLRENDEKNKQELEDVLRILCSYKFNNSVTYEDVKHLFSDKDLEEQNRLSRLIARIEGMPKRSRRLLKKCIVKASELILRC